MKSDILTKEAVKSGLNIRKEIETIVYDTVSSTNDAAKELALEGRDGEFLVLADGQSRGKGRLGRSFASPKGTGLYMSLVLRPTAQRAGGITVMAAVAACRAIKSVLNLETEIKWVNDLLYEGKKVCGILAEAVTKGDGLDFVVLGIGINLYAPQGGFPEEVAEVATALLQKPRPGLRAKLAAEIVNELYTLLEADALPAKEYAARCCVPGHSVNVLRAGTIRPAQALALDDQCRLLVRYEDGEEETLSSGEVSIRLT